MINCGLRLLLCFDNVLVSFRSNLACQALEVDLQLINWANFAQKYTLLVESIRAEVALQHRIVVVNLLKAADLAALIPVFDILIVSISLLLECDQTVFAFFDNASEYATTDSPPDLHKA